MKQDIDGNKLKQLIILVTFWLVIAISPPVTNQTRTSAVQQNATKAESPGIAAAPLHNENPGPVNTSLSIDGSVTLAIIILVLVSAYYFRKRLARTSPDYLLKTSNS